MNQNSILKRDNGQYLALACMALAFLLPNLTQPWLSFYRSSLAFIGIVLLAACLYRKQVQKVQIPMAVWLFSGSVLLLWLQYFFGMIYFHGQAIVISLFIFGVALAWLCGATLAATQERHSTLVKFMFFFLGTALVSAIIGLMQWFGLADAISIFTLTVAPGTRIISNMSQPNHLATVLLMGLGAALYLSYLGKVHHISLVLFSGLLTVSMVLTESKTGMLSLLAMCLFYALALLRLRRQFTYRQGLLLLVVCCVGGILLFSQLPVIKYDWWVMGLAYGEQRELTHTVSSRIIIYRQVWEGIGVRPWFGYGWGNTMMAIKQGAQTVVGFEPAANAHNLILDMLAWFGLPIGGTLTLILGYWLIRYYVIRLTSETVMICIMLVPFWVHCMTEFPFAFAYFSFPVALLCGFISSVADKKECGRISSLACFIDKRTIALTTILASLLGLLVFVAYVFTEEQFYKVRLKNNKVALAEPYAYKPTLILDQLDRFMYASELKPSRDLPQHDLLVLKQLSDTLASPLIQFNYVLTLAMKQDVEHFQKELISLSHMRDPVFNREMYKSIQSNSAITADMKQEAQQILGQYAD